MPLPSGGAWPPPEIAPVHSKIAEWSAWYAGDPDALSAVYGGASTHDTTGFFASERGGWRAAVGKKIERWFWGTRTPASQPRSKLHVPLASDIAVTGANLLFAEPVSITSDDVATRDRLEVLAEEGALQSTLIEGAELSCALGGVYLRVCWDLQHRPEGPWLAPVHADAAIPEWRWGMLTAATFWRVVADDGQTVVRHLERHEMGVIFHGLYEGTADDLGHMIPLAEHEATAPLAESVNADGAILTGIPFLTVEYVPNMRPNRIWRSQPSAAYLGRSDYQGVEPLLDRLDEVYSSWERDIRLAKARLIVPQFYIQSAGRGQGGMFDPDQELYEAVNALTGGERLEIHPNQFAIRVDEHMRTSQDWTEKAVRGAGYSIQSFGERGDVAVTATEIVARQERSFTTRGRKIGYWRPGLGNALRALLAIDAHVFGSKVAVERPRIEWPDGVATDPKALAETLALYRQAQAASTEVMVRMLHPDWEDDEVTAEVAKIQDELDAGGSLVADPFEIQPTAGEEDDDEPAPGDEDQGDEAEDVPEPAEK